MSKNWERNVHGGITISCFIAVYARKEDQYNDRLNRYSVGKCTRENCEEIEPVDLLMV